MADYFNNYFNSGVRKLTSCIDINESCRYKTQHAHSNSIFLVPSDAEEVKKIFLTLKKNNAPGLDNIKLDIFTEIIATVVQRFPSSTLKIP